MTLIDAEPAVLENVSVAPRRETRGKPPVVVFLHGVGGDETNFAPLFAAVDARLRVFSVRAPILRSPSAFGWFDVRFEPDPVINADHAESSRRSLIAFLESAVTEYDLEPRHVYIVGFSQGAIIGASVALTRPDLVAGVVMLSGRVLPEIAPLVAPPHALGKLGAFVAHGRFDTKLPIRHAHATRELLSSLGVNLTYREYDTGHEIDENATLGFNAWLTNRLDQSLEVTATKVLQPGA